MRRALAVVLLAAAGCSSGPTAAPSASPSPSITVIEPFPSRGEPPCIRDAVYGTDEQPREGIILSPPEVSPARGGAGTVVTVTTTGLLAGESVTALAMARCEDVAAPVTLGSARADDHGIARVETDWPDTPDGTYFLVAVPCVGVQACDPATGSAVGGPFTAGG